MSPERATRAHAWPGFIAVCTGMFMLLLDGTVLNVAQKAIRDDFDADLSAIQWMLDVYLIAFTIPLLMFGWCGDRFGQRRVFMGGIMLFVGASMLCALAGLAGGPTLLIAARVLQGIGGAAMLSQVLALIVVLFEPERRAAAFGVASALGGLAAITGPLVGGILVELAGWESVFLLNLPVGLVVLLAVWRYLPPTKRAAKQVRPDLPGMALSGVALMALAYAIIEGGHRSWTASSVTASFIVGTAAIVALVWWERRAAHPMVPLAVFRDRAFVAGTLGMILFNLAYGGIMLPLSIYLQDARGLSASAAGRVLIPVAIGIAVAAPLAGRWSERVGPARLMTTGFLVAGAGMLATSLTIGEPVGLTAGLLGVAGIGVGMTISQANTIPMRSVAPELASRASGALNLARMAAMTLSIAIIPTIAQAAAGGSSHADAGTPLPQSARVLRDGLSQGVTVALIASGVVMLVGALVTALLLLRSGRVTASDTVELRPATVASR